jgi:hypothetical protein
LATEISMVTYILVAKERMVRKRLTASSGNIVMKI